jgi:N-acetylglucosamine kinase-like BadF-type ATPase
MQKTKEVFYLGVEGGATKSTAILTNENGTKRVTRIGKSLNYHALGKNETKQNLASLLKPLIKKVEGGKIRAVFGLAGLDTPKDARIYETMIKATLPRYSAFQLVNDTKIALEARCPNTKDRFLVISGTGSNVYGESGRKKAFAIGWDFILGDEGSGYAIGQKVLKAFIQSFDGRTEKSILEKLVLQETGSKTFNDFYSKFYQRISADSKSMKYYIASFAPLIDEALRKKDPIAIAIRQEAVWELARGVSAVAKKIGITPAKSFCVGLTGSQWKMPGFRDRFENVIKKRFPKAEFSQNTDSGAWGAVLLAKKLNK